MAKDERPYAKVDLGLPNNRKFRGLSDSAKWLYVATLCWCGKEMNDGVFQPTQAVAFAGVPLSTMDDLIGRDLIHEKGHLCDCPQPDDDGDMVVHDYHKHNRSAVKIRQIRAERRAAGKVANHKRWHKGDIESCLKCDA